MGALEATLGIGNDLYAELSGENARNRKMEDDALARINGLHAPTLSDVSAGTMAPNAYGDIRSDPRAMAAQQQALDSMLRTGQQGYTIEDQAANQQMLGASRQQEASQRGALQQSFNARGQGGSGFAAAAQLSNQQGAANRANESGLQLAASGRARALQAMQSAGQMGSQMRGQSFDEQARRADAQNDINSKNAQMAERAKYYNSGLQQQRFGNERDVASIQSNASLSAVDRKRADEERRRRSIMGAGGAADDALKTAATAMGGF